MSDSESSSQPPNSGIRKTSRQPIKDSKPRSKVMERQDSKAEDSISSNEKAITKEKKLSSEDQKIREKIRSMPQNKKDQPKKKIVPLLAKSAPKKVKSVNTTASVAQSSQKMAVGWGSRYQKRKYMSNTGESAFTHHIVNNSGGRNFPASSTSSVAAARGKSVHAVNTTRIPLPAANSERKLQPPPSTSRRPQSPNYSEGGASSSIAGTEHAQRRVETVKRARLYLLQQMGPNSFLIGGDSPDHKFRVKIGSQHCTCGRGPHCLHVLFVMLRVFQVKENDPCLWNKTLKNYEVEALCKTFHARRTSKLKELTGKKKKQVPKRDPSIEKTEEDGQVTSEDLHADEDQGVIDEDTCPICLLDMVEGESLVECKNGCQNKLHHHCIDIWFQNCKKPKDHLTCPICQVKWNSITESDVSAGGGGELLSVPPNTRVPSPIPQSHQRDEDVELPHVEPIAEEHLETATPWIPVLGEDLVACMFSRNWTDREISLRQLNHLIRQNHGSFMSDDDSSGEGEPSHKNLECYCEVLTYMLRDPVYKVFVAALKTLRNLLGYIACRSEVQTRRMEELLKPIVESILLKCADSNRKMCLLSISAIEELVKGQHGEVAFGRELENPGNHGIDGIKYILSCVLENYKQSDIHWQWILGRLQVLENIIEEYGSEFTVHRHLLTTQHADTPRETRLHSQCVMRVLNFVKSFFSFNHSKVKHLATRIFYRTSKLQVGDPVVYGECLDLLDTSETCIQLPVRRKLVELGEKYRAAEGEKRPIESRPSSALDSELSGDYDSIFVTPVLTPDYSPCPSPDHRDDGDHVENSNAVLELNLIHYDLTVPPNSPEKPHHHHARHAAKRPGGEHSSGNSEASGSVAAISGDGDETDSRSEADTVSSGDKLSLSTHSISLPHFEATDHGALDVLVSQSTDQINLMANKAKPTTSSKYKFAELHLHEDDHSNLMSFSTELAYDAQLSTNNDDTIGMTHEEIGHNRISRDHEDGFYERSETVSIRELPGTPVPSLVVSDDQFSGVNCDVLSNADSQPFSISAGSRCVSDLSVDGEDSLPVSTEDIKGQGQTGQGQTGQGQEQVHRSRSASVSSTQANMSSSSQTGSLTGDFSDILSPVQVGERVSFKTEVATSPQHSSSSHGSSKHSHDGGADDDCHCKEEVEKEEAQALVAAMEQSHADQSKLPFIPGLSAVEQEETLTIHVQRESTDGLPDPMHSYMESVDWTRGPMLGTGAFSTVYQARDHKTGAIMCVKQISFCRNTSEEQVKVIEAVEEEIDMMAKLKHPNIVRILGATRQGSHFFMFVEWMPGGSVSTLLDIYGAFSKEVMISYTLQVLKGLAYLHENHVLHRDLKGANLLVDSTGQRVRIGDFGAAARLASRQTGAGEFQGQLLGTIAFMAPEVLRGESYGRSCDIWSVGCSIIEMCTTKPPWGASAVSNHLALIFKIASTVTPPQVPENIFPPLRDLTLRCLEVNRDERPSAKDLIQHPVFTMHKR